MPIEQTNQVDDSILDSIDSRSSVLFYPSACQYADEFQDMPYDAVILNSHEMRRTGRQGKVYCLNLDNNELLGMFCAKEIRISALVIIRDGCVEGGSYECITRPGFFGRLMPVIAQLSIYSCDHEQRSTYNVPARFEPIDNPPYVNVFRRQSVPLGRSHTFRVSIEPVVERDVLLGQIRVRVIRDSIWRGIGPSDLVVIRHHEQEPVAAQRYLIGRFPNANWSERFEFVSWEGEQHIQRYLEWANERKLSRLLLTPIARGQYQAIADEIRHWDKPYPQEVIFYHLHANDYRSLFAELHSGRS